MYAFDYVRVHSVEEASSRLAAKDDARLLAGGMSLIPTLRHRLARVSELVDLSELEALRGVEESSGRIRIGAMTTHDAVSKSPIVLQRIPALAALAGRIGDPLVRNRGTIGGSLANNDPAACYPAALLGLGGGVVTNRRRIAADAFILGMFETALEPGELILAVEFPIPDCASHMKLENFASRFSLAGVFLSKTKEHIRIGVTGVKDCAFRATILEEACRQAFRAEALDGILIEADNVVSDVHADADYRRHLVTELAKRAVKACLGEVDASDIHSLVGSATLRRGLPMGA